MKTMKFDKSGSKEKVKIRRAFLVLIYFVSTMLACSPLLSARAAGSETGSVQTGGEFAGGEIVAQGKNGFQVTQAEVDAIAQFYRKHLFIESDYKLAYARETVKLKLFDKEAKRLNLEVVFDGDESTEDKETDDKTRQAVRMRTYAKAYINDVVWNEPIDDSVIVSYYRANPEKFRKRQADDEDAEIPEDAKKTVKMRILKSKFNDIMDREKERLMEEYEVRFYEEEKN